MANPKYLVGIDLGTTHTVVAYAEITKNLTGAHAQLFEIEQLIGPGEIAARPLLPSFRYHPAHGEIADVDKALPWESATIEGIPDGVVGEWARELGSKSEGRLVASAKSWLSHGGIDPTAEILPWASAEEVEKVSPVSASASYLLHVKQAWNHRFADAPLENQEIVITIPASFDEGARSLTLEAARMVGLNQVLLLEEPQAVCYDWFASHRQEADVILEKKNLLLVVDVGGGTTDLSLIQINKQQDSLALTRVGVGDHLMLGGDNVDLALARVAEHRISEAQPLKPASLAQLVQQCRQAKETFLSEQSPEEYKVTVLGSGSRLIGGAKSAVIQQAEALSIALDGFLPPVELGEKPQRQSAGLVEFGLPYERDPAITRHISEFLSHHRSACEKAFANTTSSEHENNSVPDVVLFNGGVFKSKRVEQQLIGQLQQWRQGEVLSLLNERPDESVAFGGVAYLLARRGAQQKIGGGSARSYFIAVETDDAAKMGLCILPKGAEEGAEMRLPERVFALRVGQPVHFYLLSSSRDTQFQVGDLVDVSDEDSFIKLPPLEAVLPASGDVQEVEVALVTRLTEVGTIQMDCVALAGEGRWNVEFELRKKLSQKHQLQLQLPDRFPQAVDRILDVYGSSKKDVSPKSVKALRAELEKLLGKRQEWDSYLLRELFQVLIEHKKHRRRSAQHEKLWFNLAGYCLRPGYGFPGDEWRVEQLWQLYQQGLQFSKENQSWAEWWTLWRRVSGGLSPEAQLKLYKDVAKFINPGAARNTKVAAELKNRSYEDMVRLVGGLEHLPLDKKQELGQWLLKRLDKSSETPTAFWSLGRIGARSLLYGGIHSVVPPDVVSKWLDVLFKKDWLKHQNIPLAVTMMSKMTGDRSVDLEDPYRQRVVEKLQEMKAPSSWINMVTEVTELAEDDQKSMYGEALPVGIRLIQ